MAIGMFGKKKESNSASSAGLASERAPRKRKTSAKEKKTGGEKRAGSSTKGSGQRFIFIIGDDGAILVFMQGKKVLRRLFSPSAQPAHTEATLELLRSNPGVPIYMLLDVLDQQYVPHTFPPVSSLSVNGLVKRRIDRDFQADDLKGALPLGRDKTARNEWKFLLIAIARTPLLSEWLDLLVEMPNEFKGIYLSPIESIHYLDMLVKPDKKDKPIPWKLLISHNKVSGFRQVVFHNGKLVFTRVSQAIDEVVPAVIAGNVEQEIINTVEYIKRLGFRESGDLQATIIVAQDVAEMVDVNRFAFAKADVFTPFEVAEALGLVQAALSADRFGDVVMAAAFGISKKRGLRFSTPYIDKLAKLYIGRMAINLVAALAVLTLLGMTGGVLLKMSENFTGIEDARRKSISLRDDLDKQKTAVANLNENTAFKIAVTATHDAYFKEVSTPDGFIKEIAGLLTKAQRVRSFNWSYKPPGESQGAAAGKGGGAKYPVSVEAEFDFSEAGSDPESLTRAANTLIDTMKEKLPHYEITADPFPWIEVAEKKEKIVLGAERSVTVSAEKKVLKIKFSGPKAVKP